MCLHHVLVEKIVQPTYDMLQFSIASLSNFTCFANKRISNTGRRGNYCGYVV